MPADTASALCWVSTNRPLSKMNVRSPQFSVLTSPASYSSGELTSSSYGARRAGDRETRQQQCGRANRDQGARMKSRHDFPSQFMSGLPPENPPQP